MLTFKQFMLEMKITLNKRNSSKTVAFMRDYHSSTSDHPFDNRSRLYGNATLEVSPIEDNIHLHDIRSFEPGAGHKAIEHIKSLANKHDVKIAGIAKAYGQSKKYPMSSKQLSNWYSKRGFNVGRGNTDDGYSVSYKPRNKEK